MRRTSSRLPSKSLIALVLVVISFLMMVFPWVNISIEVMERTYSVSDILDLVCRNKGISSIQFERNLQTAVANFVANIENQTNIAINANTAVKMINNVLDGGISLLDGATVFTYVSEILKDINAAARFNPSGFSALNHAVKIAARDLYDTIAVSAVGCWMILAISVAVFAFAIYTLLNDRKAGVIVYAIWMSVLLIGTSVIVLSTNNLIKEQASDLLDAFDDLLRIIGNGSTNVSLTIFRLTIAPFISVIGAVTSVLIMVWERKTPPVWVCGKCGYQNILTHSRCIKCGNSRVVEYEGPVCPYCGVRYVPGEAKHCGKCGNLLPVSPVERICPNCGRPLKGHICTYCNGSHSNTCRRCGKKIPIGTLFCTSCAGRENGLQPPDDLD